MPEPMSGNESSSRLRDELVLVAFVLRAAATSRLGEGFGFVWGRAGGAVAAFTVDCVAVSGFLEIGASGSAGTNVRCAGFF